MAQVTDITEQTTAVAVKTDTTVPPAIAEMRRYAEDGYKVSKMNKGDRAILAAATGTPLQDYSKSELVETLLKMFNFIALDVGYRKPTDEMEWQYSVTRIAEVLSRYHTNITITDVKTAFELLLVGELDPHLPRNGNGEPDRAHYQCFNVEYVSKVITAYKKRQCDTVKKARELRAPEPPKAITSGGWDKQGIAHRVFDEYKKTHRLKFGGHEDVVLYEYLAELQLIDPVEITDADKVVAFQRYCIQADLGYRSFYEARWVRRQGKDAREIQPLAYTVALHRVIKAYFDTLIKKEKS